MPAYLRDTITGEVVSAAYLDDRHARAALCDSELLDMDRWMADKTEFPRHRGLHRGPIRDLSWPAVVSIRLGLLERAFQAACRDWANGAPAEA